MKVAGTNSAICLSESFISSDSVMCLKSRLLAIALLKDAKLLTHTYAVIASSNGSLSSGTPR